MPRYAPAAVLTLVAVVMLWRWSESEVERVEIKPSTRAALKLTLNINTASAEELALLPGIGPTIAKRIIIDREKKGPFPTLETLERVNGIGRKLIERIRPYVRVE